MPIDPQDYPKVLAAVEELFVEPAPGPFPLAAGVDVQRVKHHDERPQAAEGRVRLRPRPQ